MSVWYVRPDGVALHEPPPRPITYKVRAGGATVEIGGVTYPIGDMHIRPGIFDIIMNAMRAAHHPAIAAR